MCVFTYCLCDIIDNMISVTDSRNDFLVFILTKQPLWPECLQLYTGPYIAGGAGGAGGQLSAPPGKLNVFFLPW